MTDAAENVDTSGVGDTLGSVFAANASDEIFLTDRGNGRRFAEMYRDVARYVVDEGVWVVRQGSHWVRDDAGLLTFALTGGVIRHIRLEATQVDDDETRTGMLRYATLAESERTRRTMVSCAREHPEVTVTADDLDADPDLLAVPDGVVDLRTGEWRPARDDEMHTRHTTVTYDPGATSPHLDLFLKTFVPVPEDQRTLFALLGYAIRGGNPSRVLGVLHGGTTSGKSQLLGALKNLLGDYSCAINVSVFRGNLDDKPRPDLVRAMPRRVAYAVEASKTWEMHADQVKRLTGGTDPVPYRDLYGGIVEKIPRFTPLIITNEMPRVKGADGAFRKRVVAFHFDRSLPPEREDTRIREAFVRDEGCLRALLARLVAGARDEMFLDGVRWDLVSRRLAADTLLSHDKLDHIMEFTEWLKERGTLVVDATAPVSHCARLPELHSWYVRWVEKHGSRQDKNERLGLTEFNNALRDRGWDKKVSAGTRWVGMRLTEEPSVWGT